MQLGVGEEGAAGWMGGLIPLEECGDGTGHAREGESVRHNGPSCKSGEFVRGGSSGIWNIGTRINPPRGPSDRSCLPSRLGHCRLGGEMNRSQKGRAVRFTAAALRQRAKSKKTQSWRANERERDPRSGSRRVDGRTDGRTARGASERVGAAAKRR